MGDTFKTFFFPHDQYQLPWPVSKIGRAEIMADHTGKKKIDVHFNIDQKFEPNVKIPEWTYNYEAGVKLMEAMVKKDRKNIQLHNDNLMVSIKDEIPMGPIDKISMGRAMANLEHVAFGTLGVNWLLSHFKKKLKGERRLALLNPDPGTISRFQEHNANYKVEVFITRDYKSEEYPSYMIDLKGRMVDCFMNLNHQLTVCKAIDLDDRNVYYTGFYAEKSQSYGAKHYFGFELNPYIAESKGFLIDTIKQTGACYEYTVQNSNYKRFHRYYHKSLAHRYCGDVLLESWGGYNKWFSTPTDGIFNLITTQFWDFLWLPPRLDYCDFVDAKYCSLDTIEYEGDFVIGISSKLKFDKRVKDMVESDQRKYVVDLKSPLSFSCRQQLLMNMQLPYPYYEWSKIANDPVLIALPSLSRLIIGRGERRRGKTFDLQSIDDDTFIIDQDLSISFVGNVTGGILRSEGEVGVVESVSEGQFFFSPPYFGPDKEMRRSNTVFEYRGRKIKCSIKTSQGKKKIGRVSPLEFYKSLKVYTRQELDLLIVNYSDKKLFVEGRGLEFICVRKHGRFKRRTEDRVSYDLQFDNRLPCGPYDLVSRVTCQDAFEHHLWMHVAGGMIVANPKEIQPELLF